MQRHGGKLAFSPSDLATFMESRFVSFMDRLFLEKDERAVKDEPNESIAILRQRGILHETQYLERLKQNNDVYEVPDNEHGLTLTRQAMQQGHRYIYQAHLALDPFFGKCDLLVRIDGCASPALNVDYIYEPCEIKLALKPKPYFLMQLCSYAEMLRHLQGVQPTNLTVVLGDGTEKSFRTADFFYFYSRLKADFLHFQQYFDSTSFPDEIEFSMFCEWQRCGEAILEQRDDLSRVANVRKSQIVKLRRSGITTLTELANAAVETVDDMSTETFAKLRQQAYLQLNSTGLSAPLFEILPPQKDKIRSGLMLLPPMTTNDIWFDMEGYPHVDGGLEYLFGACYLEGAQQRYFERWAHNEEQEKLAFEEFADWAFNRYEQDRGMHIYHYGSYEHSAMRRLMGKYASREYEIDQLLRNDVFVDLYTVLRQSLQLGEPRYSIKNVEHLYRNKRDDSITTAMDSVLWYYKWLVCKDGNDAESSKLLSAIRQYNLIDCQSTYELYSWLRELQTKTGVSYMPLRELTKERPRDDADAAAMRHVIEKCGDGPVPTILAQLLHFHKREEKPIWWAIFDKRSWTENELYADLESLAGLCATERWGVPTGKSKLYEFTFDPDQETKIEIGDTVCFYRDDGSFNLMTVKELDTDTGRIAITSSKNVPPKQLNVVQKDLTGVTTISDSIAEIVDAYCSGRGLPSAISQFLERSCPRILNHPAGEPVISLLDKPLLPQIIDVIKRLDGSSLCIQGPPGTGKTYTGAQAIVQLIRDGKRIGVTSNSHKAIEVMLNAVGQLALENQVSLSGAKIGMDRKDSEPPTFNHPGIVYRADAERTFGAFQLVGGTAYAFSRNDAAGVLDYLFVDEAGQVAVADLVGMGRCAKNIVLLGDQMQLEQPTRGSHPGDSGMSTLQYYLKGYESVPPERGIFLGLTRRLPPSLCEFVSSAFYAGRLTNIPSNADRKILNPLPRRIRKEAGLLFEAVTHAGCVQSSEEEAGRIIELIDELRRCQFVLDGQVAAFTPESHVLIVAPYNKQVRLLKKLLPAFEIGTVDKFQGKEKPVVIISMADSHVSESSRGMEFLFSKNRLNVAISRAQVLAIVLANPTLGDNESTSLKNLSLLNLFSRIVHEGNSLTNEEALYTTAGKKPRTEA